MYEEPRSKLPLYVILVALVLFVGTYVIYTSSQPKLSAENKKLADSGIVDFVGVKIEETSEGSVIEIYGTALFINEEKKELEISFKIPENQLEYLNEEVAPKTVVDVKETTVLLTNETLIRDPYSNSEQRRFDSFGSQGEEGSKSIRFLNNAYVSILAHTNSRGEFVADEINLASVVQ